jgi:DNA-binding response OmpR family regulator
MVKPTIAVVDDDPDMRQLLQTVLSEANYAVRCWPSGLAAFDSLVRSPPALIILDLSLGDDPEAGWEILTLLRAEPRTASIPAILLSANREFLSRREHILRTKKRATICAKPFEIDALLAQIQQTLSRPEMS